MATTHFSGPVSSAGGLIAGATGSTITLIKRGTISVDAPSIGNGAVGEVTLTISGAATGDTVIMNPPTAGMTAGLGPLGCTVSAANTVKLRIANLSGGTVDEAAATWTYAILRS